MAEFAEYLQSLTSSQARGDIGRNDPTGKAPTIVGWTRYTDFVRLDGTSMLTRYRDEAR
jgi:hypothetical protein